MIGDKAEKLQSSLNVIIDDVTVIGLSTEMLELSCKQSMNKDTKRYFKNIKNHCNNIVKTINENTDKTTKKN